MSYDPLALVTPRILVVDDERQIHASLRLRLASDYELVCCFDAAEALRTLEESRFDLCFVDIHMPKMDGLTFIESAQRSDPALGYVVLSAFDTSDNLRRTIPLHVFDFVGKPLPERHEFESRLPAWIERTRQRRRDDALAQQAGKVAQNLDSARLEREVELVASETARDALLQTANLLTTIHAHLISAVSALAPRAKSDPQATQLLRNLDEARKTADAAASVADGFFNSAYASRDTSPALIDSGIHHAIGITSRLSQAEIANKSVDFAPSENRLPLQDLSGIDFLLMMVPAIGAALLLARENTTVRIDTEPIARFETIVKDPALRGYLWVNRKSAKLTHSGVRITVSAAATPFSRTQAEAWLRGDNGPLSSISARGLIAGLQKTRGLLAISLSPQSGRFHLVLALPT